MKLDKDPLLFPLGGDMKVRVHNASHRPLSYATEGSSGIDLRADLACERFVEPGQRWKVMTGVSIEIPPGYEGQVRGRSGLAIHHGIVIPTGTIDSDYRGEISVILINHGNTQFRILPGDRIAQLVISPVVRVELEEVQEAGDLGRTDRGAGGFGSTGR
jgi:dUTP pyrophosphatase